MLPQPRKHIPSITAYPPGKPIEEVQREFGLDSVIKLASNENPLGPSPRAVAAIKESLAEGHLYPDNSCHLLKEKLAAHLDIPAKNIAIGNGTTELIFLMGVAFLNSGETFIMSQSSFIMGKMVAQVMDSRLVEVPLRENRHDLEAIQPPIRLDVATGTERYVRLNGQEQELKAGDMMIADAQGVISSVIYGPDSRTRITPVTGQALFTVYAPPGIGEAAVEQHLKDIEANAKLIAPQAETDQLRIFGTD